MSDTVSDTSDLRRVFSTPMRDLLRGRITGRFDWRRRVADAALPAEVGGLIVRLVRRTKLWRSERAAVADELIAHFADGIASGENVESLIRSFGDERAAAKLIRRAKRRNRPLAWHFSKYLTRGLLIVLAIYGLLILRMFLSSPTVKTDYLAELNAPVLSVPVEQRAWPYYRKAALGLDLLEDGKTEAEQAVIRDRIEMLDAAPGDARWPELVTWIGAHAADIELIRAGAAKPALGFVLGPNGSAFDPELHWLYRRPANLNLLDESIITILIPDLQYARRMARVLADDANVALEAKDANRLTLDLESMRGLSQQLRPQFILGELVSCGIDELLMQVLERALAQSPDLLDEAQLVRLAHRLGQIGGRTADTVADLHFEQMAFRDVLQRLYTDDGNGDGRLTGKGAATLPDLASYASTDSMRLAVAAVGMGLMPIAGSRQDIDREYDRLLGLMRIQFSRPGREVVADGSDKVVGRRVQEIRNSTYLSAKYLPLTIMVPDLNKLQLSVEKTLSRRDGVSVGLALEAYRRRNGGYPETLGALTPELLPQVPEDRIVGGPVRYRLIDGRPLIYSVGVDHDDDGGALPKARDGESPTNVAARWTQPEGREGPIDGDWILYDGRPAKPAPSTQPATSSQPVAMINAGG